jgi:hypothetical protein
MLFVRKGWIVPREENRAQTSILLEYRILTPEEFVDLSHNSDYAHTPVTAGSLAGSLAALCQVPPHSMLAKGVPFASREPLNDGGTSEFTLAIRNIRLRFLGKLTAVHTEKGLRETVHHATLHPTAVHQGDLKRLTDNLGRKS